MNSLVLILKLLALALTLGKLRLVKWLELLLECRWASRKIQPRGTPTYNKTCCFTCQKLTYDELIFSIYKLQRSV